MWGASRACAVSPPPIDNSRLPEPAPARPPQPTVQREMCAVPSMTPDADRANASGQLSGLDLPQVWKLTRGSGQRVAVIDTGVSPHSRLPDTAAGGDYVFTGDGTQDCDGHGTAVAGIISAAPDPHHMDGFSGVAPGVSLISIRQSSTKFGAVADPSNSGFGDVDTMAQAVRTAADLGASVINISSVACIRTGSALDDRALGAALSYAVDVKNVVVVVAAGNTGAGQCPAQPTRSDVGHGDGCGQSGLVRRLRADRGLGERARRTVVVHPCRTLGGCRCPRRGGDIAELVGRRIGEYPWWARMVRLRFRAPATPLQWSAGWRR